MFKPNQLVVAIEARAGNWRKNEVLLYLGEIVQMPGHVIIVNGKGKIMWGVHDDNFREPTVDEV